MHYVQYKASTLLSHIKLQASRIKAIYQFKKHNEPPKFNMNIKDKTSVPQNKN